MDADKEEIINDAIVADGLDIEEEEDDEDHHGLFKRIARRSR